MVRQRVEGKMMRRMAAVMLVVACSVMVTSADQKHGRPKILGIASAHFYSTDLPAARQFYQLILHPAEPCAWCEETGNRTLRITLPSGQQVTFSAPDGPAPKDLLREAVLATDNSKAIRSYLHPTK